MTGVGWRLADDGAEQSADVELDCWTARMGATRRWRVVSVLVSSGHGDDPAFGRGRDRGAAAARGARGPLDAGARASGGPGVHRADQPSRVARRGARWGAAPLRGGAAAPWRVIYLDVADSLHIAGRVIGDVEVRDLGLLEAAAARP